VALGVQLAARLLAFERLHARLPRSDPRRLRFLRAWLRALVEPGLKEGQVAFTLVPDPADPRPEAFQGAAETYRAWLAAARLQGRQLQLGLFACFVERGHVLVPHHRFQERAVPMVELPAHVAAFFGSGARIETDGVELHGRLAEDDPDWRDSMTDVAALTCSMLQGSLWALFSDTSRHFGQRWAWLAEWFSHTGYEAELESYMRPGSMLAIRGWEAPKPLSRKAALEAFARRRGPERDAHWVVRKWPTDDSTEARLTLAEIERCIEIIGASRAAEERIERELGPTHLELHHLRKPPWATLQQHLCHHFVANEGLTQRQTADLLGIATPQEVGRAVRQYRKAAAKAS
jgi:hypothetical protein